MDFSCDIRLGTQHADPTSLSVCTYTDILTLHIFSLYTTLILFDSLYAVLDFSSEKLDIY